MTDRTLVAVSAGLGQPSSTRLLADRLGRAAQEELANRELTAGITTIELRDIAHDIVNSMLTGFPVGGAQQALAEVTGADGLILVTPLFTTTYSGLFKSFVDIIDNDALGGMPVLLGATGGTPRHSLALEYSLRPLLTYLHADVVTTSVFAATDDWGEHGDRVKPLPERIRRAGRELAELVAAREAPAGDGDEFSNAPTFDQLLQDL